LDRRTNSMSWQNFRHAEFKCRCGCNKNLIDSDFVDRLQRLRDRYARPMIITSGYRCKKHDQTVGSGTGVHVSGHAVDVLVSRVNAYDLIRCALELGFTGIGAMQHGPHKKRFVHLDDLRSLKGKWIRPMLWTY